MAADVADQPGALPLLQYALTELFDARDQSDPERPLMTRGSYGALGGVSGALAWRAEVVLLGLSVTEQERARKLFGRLVSLGDGSEDTRRRVLLDELGVDGDVRAVLDAFGGARLLSFDRDPLTREPTVEVAHEAFLREWPRLRGWLNYQEMCARAMRIASATISPTTTFE